MNIKSTEATYDQNAQNYAEISLASPPWLYFDKPVLDADLGVDLNPKTTILELGCGAGKVMSYLTERGASEKKLVGVDTSSELLTYAAGLHPQATFIKQDITSLEPQPSTFDAILAVRVLEYLPTDGLATVLDFCFSSLKNQGTMFTITGHPIRVNGSDISTYQQRGVRQHTAPGNVPIELRHKTMSDYINTAVQAGFSIDLVRETGPPDSLREARPADYARYASYGAVTLAMRLSKS